MAEGQILLHMITEAISVIFSLYVIFKIVPEMKKKNKLDKILLSLFSIGAIIVDGYLLTTWI